MEPGGKARRLLEIGQPEKRLERSFLRDILRLEPGPHQLCAQTLHAGRIALVEDAESGPFTSQCAGNEGRVILSLLSRLSLWPSGQCLLMSHMLFCRSRAGKVRAGFLHQRRDGVPPYISL